MKNVLNVRMIKNLSLYEYKNLLKETGLTPKEIELACWNMRINRARQRVRKYGRKKRRSIRERS